MSEYMTPIAFNRLMDWMIEEHDKGTVFGLHRPYVAPRDNNYTIFNTKLETPFGPAAGPNTQLAQNIAAAYYGGARFFELKTVQKLDGKDLPINKPCIVAKDECYNCEWSTELYVPQAFEEYVKAWFMCKFMAVEYGLGASDGFVFNMSAGYDLEGIKTEKIDTYIESMKNAENTPIFKECKKYLQENLHKFKNFSEEDLEAITPQISNSITLSTLHGCPPDEIERIATHLLKEKHVHTFVKCNPTLLGYEYARKTLDDMGYDYIQFTDFHFKDDLQYEDAVPMLQRLQSLADKEGLEFGVKITNTFPVDVKANELPSEEMYMSGKSLYPLSISVADKLAHDFDGKLRISYSGGADAFNIRGILDAGIWPITVATTILKPGGYERFRQIGENVENMPGKEFDKVNATKTADLVKESKKDKYHVKPIKPLPERKIPKSVPLSNCFTAPCETGCPINQDIPLYLKLTSAGEYKKALEVIIDKNPLPFMTGTLCAHNCMTKCTRHFYESPVNIRGAKLIAAEHAIDEIMKELKAPEMKSDKKVAIVGGGPAGLSAAYFLSKAGIKATVFEKREKMGGAVRNVIPAFRISDEAIDHDVKLVEAMGAELRCNEEIKDISALEKDYDYVILALGACEPGVLRLEKGEPINALDFLDDFKKSNGKLDLGETVVVIGAGNTAMDVARAAKRTVGVKKVSIVYRRTKRYMPADEEELLMAIEDEVEFAELLSPVKHENGKLICKQMKLGDFDESGRRGVIETDKIVEIPADTIISSVGEKVPSKFYEACGLELDNRGKAIVNSATYESSKKNVFVVGDGCGGAATIVEGIRDGKKAAEAIAGMVLSRQFFQLSDADMIHMRKSELNEETFDGNCDGYRCLDCKSYCENCVSVCPNRANIAIYIPGSKQPQIIHADYMCNECGNCEVFCPYESAPYKDKFTLFAAEEDMEDSTNDGFALVDDVKKEFVVRIDGDKFHYTVGTTSKKLHKDLSEIIDSVYNNYHYMLFIK